VKRTEALDWSAALTTFIADNYSEQEAKDSFAQIQDMYVDALGEHKNSAFVIAVCLII
jgi:hypothetical protein